MVSRRPQRYPETFLDPNISPFQATATPFIPDFANLDDTIQLSFIPKSTVRGGGAASGGLYFTPKPPSLLKSGVQGGGAASGGLFDLFLIYCVVTTGSQ